MPIYEYSCVSCEKDIETIHKVNDPAPPCPDCGGELNKKISLAAFHLKGGGWYSDLYAGKDNKKPGSESKASEVSTNGASETSSKDKASSSGSSSDASSSKGSTSASSSSSSSSAPSSD